MKQKFTVAFWMFLLFAGSLFSQNRERAFEMNARLGMGMNLGNTFDAPSIGEWGVQPDSWYFTDIKDKGFSSVRIPIRWSTHAMEESPYTIEENFMDTIEWAVDLALANDLPAIINIHHYEEIMEDPEAHKERFLALWDQISTHFQDYNDSLYFEILNEPNGNFTAELWNEFLIEGLNKIREKNPDRMVLIGTAEWGGIAGLSKLVLPDDPNIILTVHYYEPFNFTHQGADWSGNYPIGVTWDSTANQINAVARDMNRIKQYATEHNVPVHIGEFGAIQNADDASRARWGGHLRRVFEANGFSAAYWEYASGFGVYDQGADCYYNGLIRALTDMEGACDCSKFDTVIVWNSTFERTLSPWWLNLGNTGEASLERVDGEARIHIHTNGEEQWHIQLLYASFPLVKGNRYTFRFDAYASQPANIVAQVGKDGGDYSVAFNRNVSLTIEKETYTYTFTYTGETMPKARIAFDCGFTNAEYVYFDNIYLYEKVPVSSIRIVNSNLEDKIEINKDKGSEQLNVIVLPENASNKEVTWSLIQGGDIATLSEDGLLSATATRNGTVTVRATAADDNRVTAQKEIPVTNQGSSSIEEVHSGCIIKIGELSYHTEGNRIETVSVYDVSGRLRMEKHFDTNEKLVTLEKSKVVPGINLIVVKTDITKTNIKYINENPDK
jgi:aryl-phospho-beta-D-glucosidase BglC (GH1 family)